MRLYDNDSYREEFMELVYSLLHSDGTNDRANQIIDAFDIAPAVDAEPLPPNDPLTLKQLREMGGEPVWISYFAGGQNVCMLVDAKHDVCRDAHGGFAVFENLGRTWIAYHRKPEEIVK